MRSLLILGTEDVRREYVKAARRERCEVIIGSLERITPGEAATDVRGDVQLLIGAGDQEQVLDTALHYGVSGILGIGTQEALTAAYVAQRLELAGIPYASAMLFHNMLSLRSFQERHHFRVYRYRDISLEVHVEELHWPLYVYAADDMGLEHTERVDNMGELYRARLRALRRSPCGMVIAQEHPEHDCKDASIWLVSDLVIRDGHLQPPLWNSCIVHEGGEHIQMTGYRYPARMTDGSRMLLDSECARLAQLLHLQDAQLSVVACMEQGRVPYIVSVGSFRRSMRMQGFLSALYGHDLRQDAIRIALGSHAEDVFYTYPQEGTYMACYIVRVYCSGILRRVHFLDRLLPYLRGWREQTRQGSRIYADHRSGHEIGDLFLQFPDAAVMDEITEQIERLVIVEMDDLS